MIRVLHSFVDHGGMVPIAIMFWYWFWNTRAERFQVWIDIYDWMRSQPIKRWIYSRRERRWLARQPKPNRAPYRE